MTKDELNPKQALFVAEYLKDGNGKRAAIAAGYSKQNAVQLAWQLLRKSPAVRKAIAAARKTYAAEAAYNLEAAMAETEEVMEFSIRTRNAHALVKAVELRAKLSGLLIEKRLVEGDGDFTVKICSGQCLKYNNV